jgi:hypothetical protein
LSDLKKARELEELRWFKDINRLNQVERERVEKIKAEAAARGTYQSVGTVRAVANARSEKMKSMIDARAEIRKMLAAEFPELGSETSINELLTGLNTTIENAFKAVYESVPGFSSPAIASAVAARDDQEVLQLKAYAKSEFEILKREIALNLHKKTERASGLSINTGGGHAVVNLGNIYGGVKQVINNVNQTGHLELAEGLQRLAAAINEAVDLGAGRADYLEQVRFIAEHATDPAEQRQSSVIKGLLSGLRAALQDTANVATVLSAVAPLIAQHFGFNWP